MKNVYRLPLLITILTVLLISMIACQSKDELESKDVETTDAKDNTPINSSEDANEDILPTEDHDYALVIDGMERYDISDMLYGLFLEDINYAIDGGLYAEKIKNRSFEYGNMATGNEKHGWRTLGEIDFQIMNGSSDGSYLNTNNPNYARLTNSSGSLAGISNLGFLDGLSIEKDAKYNFSAYLRSKNYSGAVTICLQDKAGTIYGETTITNIKNEWWKYETELTASETISSGIELYVLIEDGSIDVDMVSLFPADTYQNRKNGLRKDIAESLEALTPKFLRFPGGCVVEGESLHNAYNWKDSIGDGMEFMINGEITYGDVAVRPLAENIWGNQNTASAHPYYMTYGIGFYEYFLLCEDLGAAPVPILNAGLSCLIQGTRSVGTPAQSLEIGSEEFNQYVQDALDLVEFCRGGADTKWGAIRIGMGHEAPFDLTYIGIGNEQWGNVYYSRYEAFKAAFDEAAANNPDLYGNIELIVANGPVAGDTYAWNKIKLLGADYAGLVDEHYYMAPSWYLLNTERYDSYNRENTSVFLGEYAAKSNTAEAALAEAAFMTGLERNGDIVKLASYAPLFGNNTSVQWSPDLIWFNNNTVWGSVNYYVQKIFSNNKSSKILRSTLDGFNETKGTNISGKIGVGTWMTSATFDDIKVINNDTNEVLYSEDFSTDTLSQWKQIEGKWAVEDGKITQSKTGNPINGITGDVAYIGDENWDNYTLTLTATKIAGNEGFLIPFAVEDKDNFYHWNIGGWNNTVSCLERTVGGTKSGQIPETTKNFVVETGKAYEIKITVKNNTIKCYLSDQIMVNYTVPKTEAVYQVSGIDDNNHLIIKIVNVSDTPQNILIKANNLSIKTGSAALSLLAAETLGDMNKVNEPDKVIIKDSNVPVSNSFIYTAPKYSVSVIKIPL